TARFRLLRRLGEGSMGVVYEALDLETQTRVGLKTIAAPGTGTVGRFKNEFRALQGIEHDNLVNLYELVHEGGRWFFTMELVEGGDFLHHVRSGDEARLRGAFEQLAHGLMALHRAGKVHRDIKPSNILVDQAGRVVLLDFGLIADVSRSGGDDLAGTLTFMP